MTVTLRLYVEPKVKDETDIRFKALQAMGFSNARIVQGALDYVMSLPTEELIKVYEIDKALAPAVGGPAEGVKAA